jgi:hypothetical protein
MQEERRETLAKLCEIAKSELLRGTPWSETTDIVGRWLLRAGASFQARVDYQNTLEELRQDIEKDAAQELERRKEKAKRAEAEANAVLKRMGAITGSDQ